MVGKRHRALVDPTTVRLSEHFLLSDFMGNHSVYSKGYRNIFEDPDGSKLAEGEYLCSRILEQILIEHGPLSVSYGYISPELSRKIVSYQDPDKPSYHRWDKGAAADIQIHVRDGKAPVEMAHEIDNAGLPYSRMITYSESPYLCVSSQIAEGDSPREAFYENRYTGVRGGKPLFIKKSNSRQRRRQEGKSIALEHPWEGAGYPTYHGGGKQQYQHVRVSEFSVASDFLYSTHAIQNGIANDLFVKKHMPQMRQAGSIYDHLLYSLDVAKLSIVRGYESFRFNDYPLFSWQDHAAFEVVPPASLPTRRVVEAAKEHPEVVHAEIVRGTERVRIVGIAV